MQFSRMISNGSGSSHVQLNFDDLRWYDGTPFQFQKSFQPTIKENILDITWYHFIYFKGGQLFKFHSYSQAQISDDEIAPTDEQIKELIIISHKHLQQWFEERRGEYVILPPIQDISPDAIEKTVPLLKEVLLS